MTVFLVIIHFLSFVVGIGSGLANLVLGAQAAREQPAGKVVLGAAAEKLGKMATSGLVLLWITGVALVYSGWSGWGDLPGLFWTKLACVVVLTGASAVLNVTVIKAKRAGTPPPADKLRLFGMTATAMGILALILAIITFGG